MCVAIVVAIQRPIRATSVAGIVAGITAGCAASQLGLHLPGVLLVRRARHSLKLPHYAHRVVGGVALVAGREVRQQQAPGSDLRGEPAGHLRGGVSPVPRFPL